MEAVCRHQVGSWRPEPVKQKIRRNRMGYGYKRLDSEEASLWRHSEGMPCSSAKYKLSNRRHLEAEHVSNSIYSPWRWSQFTSLYLLLETRSASPKPVMAERQPQGAGLQGPILKLSTSPIVYIVLEDGASSPAYIYYWRLAQLHLSQWWLRGSHRGLGSRGPSIWICTPW